MPSDNKRSHAPQRDGNWMSSDNKAHMPHGKMGSGCQVNDNKRSPAPRSDWLWMSSDNKRSHAPWSEWLWVSIDS